MHSIAEFIMEEDSDLALDDPVLRFPVRGISRGFNSTKQEEQHES
jgi:hypothetical protein